MTADPRQVIMGWLYDGTSADFGPARRRASLPLRSALAVTTGMVRPVPCTSCGGTGRAS